MTERELAHNLEVISAWSEQVAATLNRLNDKLAALEIRLGDLSSRFDEWEIRK